MKLNSTKFHRSERVAGLVGGGALLAGGLLAWHSPGALALAWRCAVLGFVGVALGSLVFALIHQLTGGIWGETLRPFLASGIRLLPWTWLLLLPLVEFGPGATHGGPWWNYASATAFALRTLFYGLLFGLLSWTMRYALRRPPEKAAPVPGWIGPVGAIVVLFTNHFVVSDWLAALDPRWHSTAFPIVWLIGQAVAGLAVAVLAALLAGADPAQPLGYHRTLGIDWGTLLFAAAMLWCYVTFAQFLIVWSGNLPEEAGWFTRRIAGGWRLVPFVLVALHFVAPLLVLLSRRAKQDRRFLAVIAVLLLVAQELHTAWVILPSSPDASPALPWLALLLTIGLGGLWANRYLAAAREELTP